MIMGTLLIKNKLKKLKWKQTEYECFVLQKNLILNDFKKEYFKSGPT